MHLPRLPIMPAHIPRPGMGTIRAGHIHHSRFTQQPTFHYRARAQPLRWPPGQSVHHANDRAGETHRQKDAKAVAHMGRARHVPHRLDDESVVPVAGTVGRGRRWPRGWEDGGGAEWGQEEHQGCSEEMDRAAGGVVVVVVVNVVVGGCGGGG